MFVLELLGAISLRGGAHPVPVTAQQKRPLGLLAILCLVGARGLSRDRIEAYLWPESSAPRARHALDQLVYAIRQALGSDAILSTGRELRLNPDVLRADVWEFEAAIRGERWTEAVTQYQGPLLDGFHLGDSRELEAWIDTERARLRHDYESAIERLAALSAEAGDLRQVVSLLRKLANSDPLSAGPATKLIVALAAAGDRAGAVKQARQYQELVRQQLDMEPDAEIERLASTFSRPALPAAVDTAAPRPTKVRALSPSDAPIPSSGPAALERGSRDSSPRRSPPLKRSRMAAAMSVSILIVLLIGAVTLDSRQRRDDSERVAEGSARRQSGVALPAARDAYVRALDAWRDGSKTGFDTAAMYLSRATKLDPEYAEAFAALADTYVMLGYFGYQPSAEAFPRAKVAALRSIRLDSTLASALPALAYELTWERDVVGADSIFRKAVASDPTYGTTRRERLDSTDAAAHQWYPILLTILGHKPEPIVASRRAATQDRWSLSVPVIEVTFTKWTDVYPTLSGFTSYGPSTLGGQILSRIDDGAMTHLVARYDITDPDGKRSFKAVIQGEASDKTGKYEMNGIVTWGWMTGAHVHATFQRITPCEFGKLNVCFRGTIQLQRSAA